MPQIADSKCCRSFWEPLVLVDITDDVVMIINPEYLSNNNYIYI